MGINQAAMGFQPAAGAVDADSGFKIDAVRADFDGQVI